MKYIRALCSLACIAEFLVLTVGCKNYSEIFFPETMKLPMEVKTGATKLRAAVILDSYDFVRAKAFILKFDWDGHCLDSFDTGHYVDALSVGVNAVLYGCGYDDDGTRVLWRLERE